MNPRRKVSFFIVGAPKCGTTALSDFLAQHPQIAMLRKEMHHFGSDLQLRRERPSRADYEESIARLKPAARAIGDASVFYLRSELAAAEIKAYNPQARIFILLRHPLEAMFSLHAQLVQMVDEDIRDFGQALAAEQDRRYGRRIPPHTHAAFVLQYRQMVDFAPQISRYYNVFGREAVQVILQEDLRRDAHGIYRQALAHIGVDTPFVPQFRNVNERKDIRFPFLRVFEKSISANTKERLKYALPAPMRGLIAKTYHVLAYRAATPQVMDPMLARLLQEEFKPRIQALSVVIQRDLSHWLCAEQEMP